MDQQDTRPELRIDPVTTDDDLPLMIWGRDIEGNLNHVNQAWRTFAGIADCEDAQHEWTGRIHQSDVDNVDRITRVAFERHESFTVEYRLRNADGRYRWVYDAGQPQLDEHGKVIGFVGSCIDITSRKESELAIQKSHRQFQEFADNVRDAFWVSEQIKGKILYASPAFDHIWGRSRSELYQDPLLLVRTAHPDDKDALVETIRRQLHGEITQIEYRVIRSDEEVRWVKMRGFPVAHTVGRIASIAEDVTEERRIEEQLKRAERLASLGTLAAGIAHEINNPMGAAMLAAESARIGLANPELANRCLTTVVDSLRRCDHIIKHVLAFSRHQPLAHESGCLIDVAQRAIELAETAVGRKDINIRFRTELDDAVISMSPVEMEQAIFNLLDNALKSTSGPVEVTVSIERSNGDVRVIVQDNGDGIPADTQSRVFDPFYTSRQLAGGTGLGLSIAHRIIENHHGGIELDSSQDKGTTVTITLPLVSSGSAVASAKPARL